MTLKELSDKMSKIDFCMLSVHAADGGISTRPMSNNGDVEYDGDSWFFTYQDTKKVSAISNDPRISLSFTASPSLLGKPGIFVAIEGEASIIEDKSAFEAHWVNELDIWFPQGIDTPGLVLLKAHASRIEYWDGDDNDVIGLS